jgi:glyoxylase-like metal-dependent hydrolase (beta-lactamase superfamily II)
MTPEQEERVRIARRTRTEMAVDRRAFRAVPPTIDVSDTRTLTAGNRVIEIRHPGLGNTRGDLVVYLPKERILATGDLVVWPIPYATNAYVSEWIETLDRLTQIPAATIVPGHGPVMKDWSYVKRVQAVLQTARTEVERAKQSGQGLDEVTKAVTLPDQRAAFLDGKDTRGLSFEFNFRVGLIRSLWEELDAEIMTIANGAVMQRVSDGEYVYVPRASSAPSARTATVLINQKDVVLVTAARSPAEARATIRAMRELTDKPIRFVVNTAGAVAPEVIAAYESTYADADVIGYPNARRALSIAGTMKLHRDGRVISIRQMPDGTPAVEVQRLPG